MKSQLYQLTATQAVALLQQQELTPLDFIEAAAERIEALNPTLNALPIVCLERARDQARRLTASGPPDPVPVVWLAGLPVAVKDYNDVAGVRTTHGSPIFEDHVAEHSDYTVKRLEENGAVPIAKSNVPEFAGANTFNRVFGATVNPWDTRMSVGGSSGGSAAALATGMVWLATGNDLGGSLRTPASFCSVVGLRPSPGRIARGPGPTPFDSMWVEGPMGRTVADVALMLDAQVGHEPRDPLSMPAPAEAFSAAVKTPHAPARVGYSPDLGIVPIDPEVKAVCAAAAERFADLGAVVDDGCPDFSGAVDTFQTLRALLFSAMKAPLLEAHRERIWAPIVWNIEKGLNLSAKEIARAQRERGSLYHRVAAFFRDYDILACPTAAVPPFPVEQEYVEEVAGQKLTTYVDWIAVTFCITLTGCPAISVPCGFTASGLPVGLQLVGRPRGEAALLGAARLLEEALDIAGHLPIDPRSPPA